ncbi:MAG: cobalamin-dependent protein [Magnetococcales bacterium]|nr:cobalamin-dependent protein [Magnetococcales bacterium]
MRILLILPHHNIENYGYISHLDSDFPLALGYIAAVLQKVANPERLEVFDCQIPKNNHASLVTLLKQRQFDLVGMSVFTPTYKSALYVATLVKQHLPHCTLMVGGPHPTLHPGDLLKHSPEIDLECIGEAEETVAAVIPALANRSALRDVEGIAFRDENGVVVNKRRSQIKNLDSVPHPIRNIFPIHDYRYLPGQFHKKPIMPMLTSRGCPFRCTFCEDRVLWEKKCRFRSANDVCDEIEELIADFKVKEIKFFDDTFSASKHRTVMLCEEILRRKIKIIWRICTRVDCVDAELMALMYKAGLRSINFGIESGSNMILQKMNKGFTTDTARKAVAISRNAGVEVKASFILNYPGETEATIQETLDFVRDLDLDFVGFNLFNPWMGVEMKQYVEENYPLNEKYWNIDHASAPNIIFFYQPGLSEQFLSDSYKQAMQSHYFNFRRILRLAKRIRSTDMVLSYLDGFFRLLKIKTN